MRPALAALFFLGAAACGREPGGPQAVELALHFGMHPAGTCVMEPTCQDTTTCPMDCEQRIGVFLVDATTDEVIDQECITLAPDSDDEDGELRTLADLPETLRGLDFADGVRFGRQVVLEIAVYGGGVVLDCPRAYSVDGGRPSTSKDLMDPTGITPNLWGRSAPVTIEEGVNRFDLPVECVIAPTSCMAQDGVVVKSFVEDLRQPIFAPDNFDELDVRIGFVFDPGLGIAPSFVSQSQLTLPDEQIPEWTRTLTMGIQDFPPCGVGTISLKATIPVGYPVLSCERQWRDPGPSPELAVDTNGYYVARTDVDTILGGLGTTFPAGGLLVGRVVDAFGSPVAGATVAALDGSVTPIYLNDQLQPTAATSTSAEGWFVVRDAPAFPSFAMGGMGGPGETSTCCGQLIATAPDTRSGCSRGVVGHVEGVVMATLVNVDLPCATPP